MANKDDELKAIEALETFDEAVDYLVERGLSRTQAEALARAIARHRDDPPRKDH